MPTNVINLSFLSSSSFFLNNLSCRKRNPDCPIGVRNIVYGMRKGKRRKIRRSCIKFCSRADYWKSQGRKFCDFCKCWIADNKPSIDFHEGGKKHKENVSKRLKEIHKNSAKQAKQNKKIEGDIRKMENVRSFYLLDVRAVNEIKNVRGIFQQAFEIVNCFSLFLAFRQLWPHT